jgi:Domain of unknown function (DUF4251)
LWILLAHLLQHKKLKIIMKKIVGFAIILTSILSCTSTQPLPVADPGSINKAIDSARWQFVPTQAMPLVGRTRVVTSDFIFQYTSKKIMSYLPYFGKANVGANILSGKGPLDFTSTDFIAETLRPKDGEWHVSIKPKDYSEVQQLSFNLYSNGSATLDVIMTNRSAIRFTGLVQAMK